MNVIKNIFWNSAQSRIRTGFRILLVLAIFFSIYRGYLFLLTSIGVKLYYSSESSLVTFLIAGSVRLLPGIIALLILGRIVDKRKVSDFGFHFNKNWWIDLCFGMGLGAILVSLIFVTEVSLGWITISDYFYTRINQPSFAVPFLVFLFYFFCTSVSEELLARGYLIKNLAEGFNMKNTGPKSSILIAWSLTSIIFGLAHLGNPNATFLSTFSLIMTGIAFGAGFILTGELAIPIGLHIAWNFFQANVFGFPVSGLSYPAEITTLIKTNNTGPEMWTGGFFGPEAGILGLVAMIIGIFFTIIWIRFRRGIKFREIHAPLANAPVKEQSSLV
jgi:membrane protease YdiL (CAAX protease family)